MTGGPREDLPRRTAVSAVLVMVSMLLTGYSAHLNADNWLLLACSVVFLASTGVLITWIVRGRTVDPG